MKTKFYLPFIALALMATSCNSKKEADQKGGIRLANLDQTANREMIFISTRVEDG